MHGTIGIILFILERLHSRISPPVLCEPSRDGRTLAYLKGLLSPLECKNGGPLAEQAGEGRPDGIQRLLNTARGDADGVRADLRAYVVEHFGDPRAVAVTDETGFLKKGTRSAGVKRQYPGMDGT